MNNPDKMHRMIIPHPPMIEGKVKSVFNVSGAPDKVMIQYNDKVTAGNGAKEDYPKEKGATCALISVILFEHLNFYGVKTHFIDQISHTKCLCKKVDIIPIEFVVRNICAGSICRETTLHEGDSINSPLVEYYLKDDSKNDPLLTMDRIILMGYGPLMIEEIDKVCLRVNELLKSLFERIGLTLVDFKLEFGYDADRNILLADELSPDGMRLWKEGKSFDKDLFREGKGDIIEAYTWVLEQLRHA